MWQDPVIEELHRTREEIVRECDGDFDKLCERLRADERKHPERIAKIIRKGQPGSTKQR